MSQEHILRRAEQVCRPVVVKDETLGDVMSCCSLRTSDIVQLQGMRGDHAASILIGLSHEIQRCINLGLSKRAALIVNRMPNLDCYRSRGFTDYLPELSKEVSLAATHLTLTVAKQSMTNGETTHLHVLTMCRLGVPLLMAILRATRTGQLMTVEMTLDLAFEEWGMVECNAKDPLHYGRALQVAMLRVILQDCPPWLGLLPEDTQPLSRMERLQPRTLFMMYLKALPPCVDITSLMCIVAGTPGRHQNFMFAHLVSVVGDLEFADVLCVATAAVLHGNVVAAAMMSKMMQTLHTVDSPVAWQLAAAIASVENDDLRRRFGVMFFSVVSEDAIEPVDMMGCISEIREMDADYREVATNEMVTFVEVLMCKLRRGEDGGLNEPWRFTELPDGLVGLEDELNAMASAAYKCECFASMRVLWYIGMRGVWLRRRKRVRNSDGLDYDTASTAEFFSEDSDDMCSLWDEYDEYIGDLLEDAMASHGGDEDGAGLD